MMASGEANGETTEEEEAEIKETGKKSFFSRLGASHRRTNSREGMLSGSLSHRRTPSQNTPLPFTAEEVAGETPEKKEASPPKSNPATEAPAATGTAPSQASPTEPALSAAEAGKQAALQRERAADPKAALGAIVGPGSTTAKTKPKPDEPPAAVPPAKAGARWSFSGWGSKSSGRSSGDKKYGTFEEKEGEEESEKVEDHIRRGGRVDTPTKPRTSKDRASKDRVSGGGGEGGGGDARAALESAIEKNQADQEQLRRELHTKQAELVTLLEQHTTLMRKEAEAMAEAVDVIACC